MIKRVMACNFKSFSELDVTLDAFNVLVGANASGKSSFTQIFQFLRDASRHGIRDAVSLQGGPEFLKNVRAPRGVPVSLTIESESAPNQSVLRLRRTKDRLLGLRASKLKYELHLVFRGTKSFKVSREQARIVVEVFEVTPRSPGRRSTRPIPRSETKIGEVIVDVTREKGQPKVLLDVPADVPVIPEDLFPYLGPGLKLPSGVLLLEYLINFSPFMRAKGTVVDVGIYDFDPKLPKRAVPITGRAELESDGSNLTLVLRSIIENRDGRNKFSRLVKDLLPFVERVDVQRFGDRSLLFKVREQYAPRVYLPASVVSDGTINLTALIIALYFVERGFLIIEEPERNIHPSLIAKVVGMLQDASQTKQILVTTHNPELVKHANLQSLLLMSRSSEGFSSITKPADRHHVQTFLANELGIEELFVQGLLES